MDKILLGFEVPTGQSVYMRLHHTVVCGMTQLSGKTTTLEAIINRSGLQAIAFKTKRGESGFNSYHEIPPFFKERADWRYVQSLLEATMRERMKFERSWIIKASKGAKTLKDVYQNVLTLKEKTRKDSLSESVYTVLEEYLKLVIPQIEKFTFSPVLDLGDGINVMDLTPMSLEMRSLVIRSVMEYVSDDMSNVIIVVPEAWEYLPQGRSTPVKWFAETFIRKGASIGNYLFFDSQDVAAIDKAPLRSCDNWIMGRQREVHEIDRLRDTIGKQFASEEEIKRLPLGHFFASIGDDLKKVYVLPVGVDEETGIKVAKGELSSEYVKELLNKTRLKGEDDEMYKGLYEKEKSVREDLERKLVAETDNIDKTFKELEERVNKLNKENEALNKKVKELEFLAQFKKVELQKLADLQEKMKAYNEFRDALSKILPTTGTVFSPAAEVNVNLKQTVTEWNVEKNREILEATDKDVQGQVLLLVNRGWFDQRRRIAAVRDELKRVFDSTPRPGTIETSLSSLVPKGILEREHEGNSWMYWISSDAQKLIKVKEKAVKEVF